MKINAIQCKNCNNIIYSRAQHDFRTCPCGECSIDGGLQYTRILFGDAGYLFVDIEVPDVTERILYDDWNSRADKYGLIKVD